MQLDGWPHEASPDASAIASGPTAAKALSRPEMVSAPVVTTWARNVRVTVSVLARPALGVPAPCPMVASRKSRTSSGARVPGALCASCDEKSAMASCATSAVPR